MHLEQEITFTLGAESAATLLRDRRLRKAARGKAHTARVISTYYDTRHHALRKAGGALRVRTRDGHFEQTLKFAAAGPGGMQNCEEWTVALASDQPDLTRFSSKALRRFKSSSTRKALRPLFTSDIERTTLLLQRDKSRFELALDIGHIASAADPQARLEVREVEFELIRGSPRPMLDLLLELVEHIDLQPQHRSKAERGYVLVRPALRRKQVKAGSVALNRDMTIGDAFRQIVDEALSHLIKNRDPVLRGEPGGVHQSRVAIRRIRAALRAFRRVLPYLPQTAFEGEFRRFQERLGPARDWQVFLSETLPQISDDPDARTLRRLRALAMHERKQGLEAATAALTSRRYNRLLLHFQHWLLSLAGEQRRALARPLLPFAMHALDIARRDFLGDTRALSRMSEENRHTLRKRAKRMRYAAEFFACLWEGPEVMHYLGLMGALQDRLGEANDAVVARRLLAGVAPRHLRPEALLLVQQGSELRERGCVLAAQPLWRQIQEAETFWT